MTASTPVNVTAAIKSADAQGRTFTNIRNALIGHALLTGVKQATIVNESGVDKGDVSRINSMVSKLTAAQAKRLKSLDVPDVISADTCADLATFGASHLTRKRGEAKSRTTSEPKSPEALLRDALAAAFDLIVANPEQEAGWLALARDLFTPEKVAEARSQADEDIEAAA